MLYFHHAGGRAGEEEEEKEERGERERLLSEADTGFCFLRRAARSSFVVRAALFLRPSMWRLSIDPLVPVVCSWVVQLLRGKEMRSGLFRPSRYGAQGNRRWSA